MLKEISLYKKRSEAKKVSRYIPSLKKKLKLIRLLPKRSHSLFTFSFHLYVCTSEIKMNAINIAKHTDSQNDGMQKRRRRHEVYSTPAKV